MRGTWDCECQHNKEGSGFPNYVAFVGTLERHQHGLPKCESWTQVYMMVKVANIHATAIHTNINTVAIHTYWISNARTAIWLP